MSKLFGTDGIRGVANLDLTAELAYRLGLSVARVLKVSENDKKHNVSENKREDNKLKILIGRDTRISGDMLECAIASGLCAAGADVVLAGVVSTPAVAYLVRTCGFDSGIMISASHNTSEYNGIKVFGGEGYKLSDEMENKIEEYIKDYKSTPLPTHGAIGRVEADDRLAVRYEEYITGIKNEQNDNSTKKLRVIFDCANGSASRTADKIFHGEHFSEIRFIHAEPDGMNINDKCGSTHLEPLRAEVVKGRFDIGFAFDGDADRCLAVDENGEIIDGDMIMCALADEMKSCGELNANVLVTTKLSNLGLRKFCISNKINTAATDVGDRYVLEKMLECGYNLGGEQSGHIILSDFMTTGDGQLTATLVISLLLKKDMPASKVFGRMKVFPQVSVNVKVKNEQKSEIMENSEVLEKVNVIAQTLGDSGRIILRPSGTEPLVRIMLEGEDIGEITAFAKEVESLILLKL